ncbi:MAG: alanine--glyoxylate aminotransferase family protein [Phycisphaeraceae bacterium]
MTTTTDTTLKQRLLTPGPTAVPPRVLQEMALPIIHHRTKQFQAIFEQLGQQLQQIFKTSGPVLSIAGSGTTAFEAAQVSLVRPGSKAITVAGGKFGERWQDIYDTYGSYLDVEQIKVSTDWGKAAPVDQIEQALKANPDVSVVTVVHSETSTATASDVRRIAELVRTTDALLIVDGITAVGALPVEQDAWGIDVLVTGSQKAMMLPPGLGYVGLGERAVARLGEVKPGPAYNLDLRRWLKSWKDNDVPFTPPVSLIRGQNVACEMILETGIENTIARTRRLATGTRAAFEAMGLTLVSESPSDSVSGAYYPEGINDSKFRGALRDKHGIHIAGGQDGRGGKWKGKIFRLSHMGFVDHEDTVAALNAVETEFIEAGVKLDRGAAVAAFEQHAG